MRKIISIILILFTINLAGQITDTASKVLTDIDVNNIHGIDTTGLTKRDWQMMIGCGPITLNREEKKCLDSAYFSNPSRITFNLELSQTKVDAKYTQGVILEIDKTVFKNKWAFGIGSNVYSRKVTDTFNFSIKSPMISYRGFYWSIQHLQQIGKHIIFVQKINNGFAKSRLIDLSVPVVKGKDTTFKAFSLSTFYFLEPELELYFKSLFHLHSDESFKLSLKAGYRLTFGNFNFAKSQIYNYPYFAICFKILINAKKTKGYCCYGRP